MGARTETPPPGWYEDDMIPGRERWWDGDTWTERTRRSGFALACWTSECERAVEAIVEHGRADAGTPAPLLAWDGRGIDRRPTLDDLDRDLTVMSGLVVADLGPAAALRATAPDPTVDSLRATEAVGTGDDAGFDGTGGAGQETDDELAAILRAFEADDDLVDSSIAGAPLVDAAPAHDAVGDASDEPAAASDEPAAAAIDDADRWLTSASLAAASDEWLPLAGDTTAPSSWDGDSTSAEVATMAAPDATTAIVEGDEALDGAALDESDEPGDDGTPAAPVEAVPAPADGTPRRGGSRVPPAPSRAAVADHHPEATFTRVDREALEVAMALSSVVGGAASRPASVPAAPRRVEKPAAAAPAAAAGDSASAAAPSPVTAATEPAKVRTPRSPRRAGKDNVPPPLPRWNSDAAPSEGHESFVKIPEAHSTRRVLGKGTPKPKPGT